MDSHQRSGRGRDPTQTTQACASHDAWAFAIQNYLVFDQNSERHYRLLLLEHQEPFPSGIRGKRDKPRHRYDENSRRFLGQRAWCSRQENVVDRPSPVAAANSRIVRMRSRSFSSGKGKRPRIGGLFMFPIVLRPLGTLARNRANLLVAGARYVPNLDTLCVPFRSELIHCPAYV